MLLYCLYMYANIKLVNGDISHENLQNFLTEENNDIYIYMYIDTYTHVYVFPVMANEQNTTLIHDLPRKH